MSPLHLVGLLVITTCLADVKHVLQGQAFPPIQNTINYQASEVNALAHTQVGYQQEQPQSYWWMQPNSPLKDAYEYYKKCSLKGNCSPNVKTQAGCNGNECSVKVSHQAILPAGGLPNSNIDITKNVFFNGKFKSNDIPAFASVLPSSFNSNIDVKKNPFLNGNFGSNIPVSGNGQALPSVNGHIGVQPNKPFANGQSGVSAKCGNGYTCVARQHCANGVVKLEGLIQVRSDLQICNANTEVCCRLPSAPDTNSQHIYNINNLAEVTAGKSSIPGSIIKFEGGPGSSGGVIHVVPEVNNFGESGSSHFGSTTTKPVRDVSTISNSVFPGRTVDYSNVNFGDVRFASTIKGPAYLPPFEPTQPTFRPSISTYRPPVPTTPRPTRPPQTIPVFVSTPSSPRPTYPQPTRQPTTIRPFPTFSTTTREYLPPSSSNNNQIFVRPSPSTARPVVTTGGYSYPTPTPTFGYPTTPDTSSNNVNNQYVTPGYLPPTKIPSGTNTVPSFVTPDQPDNVPAGDNTVSVTRTTQRVPVFPPLEPNGIIPSGCAAALKCVQEIYCTPDGFVSPVPVVLTKEQESNRVPTTVCNDVETGITGKCCRDPNYKDPWPSANLVNGVDDGQYREDDSLGQYAPINNFQRLVRSDAGPPGQNLIRTSSGRRTQQQISIQQQQQAFAPFAPTRGVVASSQGGGGCGDRHLNTKPAGPGPIDVNFAEIPWQAMVLRDSNRSLLCGGAIISRNAVLTTAHCVEGLETSDVLVKGGEWKLGIDEEPQPFQIVKVAVIVRHPEFKAGSLVNDLAILILAENFRPANNVGTICLPEPNQIPTDGCIATGWGKRILQLHARGAIMHSIDVKIMSSQQCEQTLASRYQQMLPNFSPNTLCGYSNRDQCKVDYGSALACQHNGHYVLSGIFAWDTGCRDPNQIGGYVAPDVEWIHTCLAKPRNELKQLETQYLTQRTN